MLDNCKLISGTFGDVVLNDESESDDNDNAEDEMTETLDKKDKKAKVDEVRNSKIQ